MLAIDLIGAQVLTPDGLVADRLSLAEGSIVADPTGRSVDMTGYRVMPGIIDVHGDGFERHVAPRRGAMKEMTEGLRATEAELAANGITTGVLAQFVSWEGGLRSLDFADQVFAGLKAVRDEVVTDLRPQLRFETHMRDLYDDLPDRVAAWGINYVCLLYTSPSPRDLSTSRMPSSA